MSKKGLITKKVTFQGTEVTMYSLDGTTWSTRPDELHLIHERHLMQQAGVSADLKGEEKTPIPKARPKKFNRVHDDSELDEVIKEDQTKEKLPKAQAQTAKANKKIISDKAKIQPKPMASTSKKIKDKKAKSSKVIIKSKSKSKITKKVKPKVKKKK